MVAASGLAGLRLAPQTGPGEALEDGGNPLQARLAGLLPEGS
jgi:hypothetical protein